jgi:hypothetical protein
MVIEWQGFAAERGRPHGRRGENPLHLVDPAEVGTADEEPRCAVAGSLPAWGIDFAELVAGDLAADGSLAEARPLGAALSRVSQTHSADWAAAWRMYLSWLLERRGGGGLMASSRTFG